MINYQQMACHTWALAANPNTGAKVHSDYEDLSNRMGAAFGYGTDLKGKNLLQVRQEVMQEIATLCEARTKNLQNVVYVCGGFRSGQVCPEHLWLEDHTAGKTYDTFIDQKVQILEGVGKQNSPFRPGCEADAFAANEIARVKVNGFTDGQMESIATCSEPA